MSTKWYSPQEISSILGVHHQTVREWIQCGKLEGLKFGKLWRVPEGALNSMMSGNKKTKSFRDEKAQRKRDAAITDELEILLR